MKALTFTLGLALGLPLGMLLPNLGLTLLYVGAVSTLAFLFRRLAQAPWYQEQMENNKIARLMKDYERALRRR